MKIYTRILIFAHSEQNEFETPLKRLLKQVFDFQMFFESNISVSVISMTFRSNSSNSWDRLEKLTGFHLLMFYDLKKDVSCFFSTEFGHPKDSFMWEFDDIKIH